MSPSSVVVYNLLVEGGLHAEAAKQLAEVLVTRDDLAHLATKADLAELKAEMHAMLHSQTKWLATTMIAMMIAMTAIFGAIVKLL